MTNLIIGGGLALISLIALIVFWIIAIVKAFKAGDTVWGILSILLSIPGLIYLFVKGHTKLGVMYVVFILLYIVGCVVASIAIQSNPELLEKLGMPKEAIPAAQ